MPRISKYDLTGMDINEAHRRVNHVSARRLGATAAENRLSRAGIAYAGSARRLLHEELAGARPAKRRGLCGRGAVGLPSAVL